MLKLSVKIIFFLFLFSSIGINYYVHIVLNAYEVITNPEGPDMSDYF